jgi:hypothetical protein
MPAAINSARLILVGVLVSGTRGHAILELIARISLKRSAGVIGGLAPGEGEG